MRLAAILTLIMAVALLVPWLADPSTGWNTDRGSIQHERR